MKNKNKTIEGLVKIEWKDISLYVKKQKDILYLTLLTDDYKLRIRASKDKCLFKDYKEYKEIKEDKIK